MINDNKFVSGNNQTNSTRAPRHCVNLREKGSSVMTKLTMIVSAAVLSSTLALPAMAETTGVASSVLKGPICAKSNVGGTTYGWPVSDASMTVVFQSSADNNRQITVWVSSDLNATNYPTMIICNQGEGDETFSLPFVAG